MSRVKNHPLPKYLDADYANSLYFHLVENIEWIADIKTRIDQFTRKARPMN